MNTDTQTRIKQLESERRLTIAMMDDAVDTGKLHLRKMLLNSLSEIDNELKALKSTQTKQIIDDFVVELQHNREKEKGYSSAGEGRFSKKIKSVDSFADVVKQRAQKEAELEAELKIYAESYTNAEIEKIADVEIEKTAIETEEIEDEKYTSVDPALMAYIAVVCVVIFIIIYSIITVTGN